MLTISSAISAGQAQTYHQKEFTSREQNYWSQQGVLAGEWQGRLAATLGQRLKFWAGSKSAIKSSSILPTRSRADRECTSRSQVREMVVREVKGKVRPCIPKN